MKTFGLMIASLVIIAAPSIANAQSVVIERGHQQSYRGHEQGHGARAQMHGDRAYRGQRSHGDKTVIIRKPRHHQGH